MTTSVTKTYQSEENTHSEKHMIISAEGGAGGSASVGNITFTAPPIYQTLASQPSYTTRVINNVKNVVFTGLALTGTAILGYAGYDVVTKGANGTVGDLQARGAPITDSRSTTNVRAPRTVSAAEFQAMFNENARKTDSLIKAGAVKPVLDSTSIVTPAVVDSSQVTAPQNALKQ